MSNRKILGLAETLAGSAVSAARHPVATVGYVVGLAKGVTEATVDAVRGGVATAPSMPTQRAAEPEPSAPTTSEKRTGERTLYGGLNTEAAPPMNPGGGGEPMVHEPQAESREVAHGEGPVDQREIDSWVEEADDPEDAVADLEAPTDSVEVDHETDETPLLDPATAKAVRSEAETLARAADPDKG